jgi:hypothetical protein
MRPPGELRRPAFASTNSPVPLTQPREERQARRQGRRWQLPIQSMKRGRLSSIIPEYSWRCPIITVESGNVDQTDEARAKRARPAKGARVQSPHKVKKRVVKQIDSERLNKAVQYLKETPKR